MVDWSRIYVNYILYDMDVFLCALLPNVVLTYFHNYTLSLFTVAIGTMDEVTHEEEISHIDVTVTKLISQSESIFKKSTDVWARSQVLKGVVNVPLRCGIRLGEGQFLFTGRVRLGQPVLQCAPRYEQWNTVLDDAVNHGLLECSYG